MAPVMIMGKPIQTNVTENALRRAFIGTVETIATLVVVVAVVAFVVWFFFFAHNPLLRV